jgi:hypothetical protein
LQRVQSVAPAALNEPPGHGLHEDAPFTDVKRPAPHVVQTERPGDGLNEPGAHDEHAVAPAIEKRPRGHTVYVPHAPLPAGHAWPAAHVVHTVAPEMSAYLPSAQAEHDVCPAAAANVP